MGQAQLDSKKCDQDLIGTGPFVKEEWVVNDHFTASRNEDYWRTDADGNHLPYLDSVEFRPFVDGDARVNALLSGQVQAMQTGGATEIVALEDAAEAGEISLETSGEYPDVSYGLLNVAKPPSTTLWHARRPPRRWISTRSRR
ncbi:MAG: ABC transporter substrate-binding protein [Microthrixaceae bacterium]|nr:ABC transporter substrate-binding protein [Microthrixaceae bacterium]